MNTNTIANTSHFTNMQAGERFLQHVARCRRFDSMKERDVGSQVLPFIMASVRPLIPLGARYMKYATIANDGGLNHG